MQLRDQPYQLVALRGREVFGLTHSQSIKTCSVPHNPPTDADPANQLPEIRQTFLKEFDQSQERTSLVSLIDEVGGSRTLSDSQQHAARTIVGELRRMLSRSALQALEPDLVILDEFQRFRDLLDVKTGGDAAELADDLFNHSDAHVLLLSATPYKPFTYAEETGPDGGHYADFLKTLDFLAASDSAVDSVRTDLNELRQAALSGEPTVDVRDRVQSQLRKWIARTERPSGNDRAITVHGNTDQLRIRAEDFNGFVTLRNVANAVRAPLTPNPPKEGVGSVS